MTFRIPSKNANSPAKFQVTFNDVNSNVPGKSTTANANAGGDYSIDSVSNARGSLVPPRKGSSNAQATSANLVNKDLRIYVSQEEKEPKE